VVAQREGLAFGPSMLLCPICQSSSRRACAWSPESKSRFPGYLLKKESHENPHRLLDHRRAVVLRWLQLSLAE